MQEREKINVDVEQNSKFLEPYYFKDRNLYLASKHGKEQALQELFEANLKVKFHVTHELDTDVFGTFSGEIERSLNPVETARAKAKKLAEKYTGALILSSEGTFGPDPHYGLLTCDSEILYLWDDKEKIEYFVTEISYETNAEQAIVQTIDELRQFAKNVSFPEQGLILKNKPEGFTETVKGIRDEKTLIQKSQELLSKYGSLSVETDLRTLHNPTRMKVIEKAGKKLIEQLKSTCPNCNHPSYHLSSREPGLKCRLCHKPTRSIKSYVYTCKVCNYSEKKMFPHLKTLEDPMYCDYCNP